MLDRLGLGRILVAEDDKEFTALAQQRRAERDARLKVYDQSNPSPFGDRIDEFVQTVLVGDSTYGNLPAWMKTMALRDIIPGLVSQFECLCVTAQK